MKFPVSIQMYTLREEAKKDFIGTLEKVAQIGYNGVELAGNGGLSSKELKKHLDRLGLKVSGSHVSLDDIKNNLEDLIKYNKEIGNKYIICAYSEFKDKEYVEELAEILSKAADKCNKEGLALGYHNHAHEFKKFDGKYGLDFLYEKSSSIFAEIDTYWVYYAGLNPNEYITKYKGRCPLVHFKDMEKGEERSFAEVGEGVIDFKEIAESCEKAGVEWIVVEQDRCKRDPFESIKISYNNLKDMGII